MEERDVVLCTVTKIEGTSVFVNIEGGGEGTIVVSEIAPGRIRNLRDYVVPHKKIVCKVLRIDQGGHVHLSLRRVTSKEKQDVMKKAEAEKGIQMTLKRLFAEKGPELAQKIQKDQGLVDFFAEAKQNPKVLEKYFDAAEREKVQVLLKEKEKEVEIKKELKLKCAQSNGLLLLKSILQFTIPRLEISYLAASRFVITLKAPNYKEGNAIVNQVVEEIQKRAKKEHCDCEILER